MESMSHDPVAGDIGSQLVDIAMQGLDSGAAALMKLTGLIPAGSEEVSMQAAMAFAAEGAQMLTSNTAAQQELLQTGTALVNIAKMYSPVDDTAADTLAFGAPGPAVQAGRRQRRVVGARRRYCPIELVGHRGISGRQLQGWAGVIGRRGSGRE
jgi:PE family